MRHLAALFASSLLLLLAAGCGDAPPGADLAEELPACDADDGGLTLPDGFCAYVVADSLAGEGGGQQIRHLDVRDNGDLYVVLRRPDPAGAVLVLRDLDGDGRPDTTGRFGTHPGTGLEIAGDYVYVGSDEHAQVVRYRLGDGLVPEGAAEVIVTDLPEQRSHAAKSIALDGAGGLYVNVGGPSNACQEQARTPGSPGLDPCPQLERQAGVWRFDAGTPNQSQTGAGTRYATGLRNAVALAWDDATGSLYAVPHGRDQLNTLWDELYEETDEYELPAEEFVQIDEGDDFGWPYCYYDHQQGRKVLMPEYGGDGQEVGRCAEAKDPIYAFPAHWAPNDLVFYDGDQFPARYQGGAFVAFHGSWNRGTDQRGYRVAFVPFRGGAPGGDHETFADGFAGVETIQSPNDARHRPTGLAVGPDGSLYIADSRGTVWRVVYEGG